MITKKEYEQLKIMVKQLLDAMDMAGETFTEYHLSIERLYEKLLHLAKETDVD